MSDERATEENVTDESATERTATEENVTDEREESGLTDRQERSKAADQQERSKAADQQERSKATDGREQEESAIDPRVKASLLWGVVGLLAFLVLVQGYELATGFRYSLAVKAGAALLVGVGATGLSYVAEPRLFG